MDDVFVRKIEEGGGVFRIHAVGWGDGRDALPKVWSIARAVEAR